MVHYNNAFEKRKTKLGVTDPIKFDEPSDGVYALRKNLRGKIVYQY